MARVAGRTVLVTGGAGDIGAATAAELVRRGSRVALLDVDGEGLRSVARELGDAAWTATVDVTVEADLRAAVEDVVAWSGRLDAVVANAAINRVARLSDLAVDDFDRVIDVNLGGVVRTVAATLPHLRTTRGYIMLVCSGAAMVQGPFQAAYNASKAGVHALGHTLRHELARDGVEVGIVYLNAIETAAARSAMAHPLMAPLDLERLMRPHPVGRTAEALASGVERRSRSVFVPRSARLAATAPAVLQRLTDWWVHRRLAG